jgi:hypothetical protein
VSACLLPEAIGFVSELDAQAGFGIAISGQTRSPGIGFLAISYSQPEKGNAMHGQPPSAEAKE